MESWSVLTSSADSATSLSCWLVLSSCSLATLSAHAIEHCSLAYLVMTHNLGDLVLACWLRCRAFVVNYTTAVVRAVLSLCLRLASLFVRITTSSLVLVSFRAFVSLSVESSAWPRTQVELWSKICAATKALWPCTMTMLKLLPRENEVSRGDYNERNGGHHPCQLVQTITTRTAYYKTSITPSSSQACPKHVTSVYNYN